MLTIHHYFVEVLEDNLLNWFNNNRLKSNPGKFHLLLSGNDSSEVTTRNKTISDSKCEKLLGTKIDNSLIFKEHIEPLCRKTS